ncbi:MAG: RNA polymerase sigma factor [Archangium sp.]|nr:RNA polymerase sigma factor [Archangium sp.]
MNAARPHLQPVSDREAAELAELAAGIARGEREAIGRFFDRFEREVNRLVWTMLGADPEHDDLVNEAFETMLKKISSLRLPGAMYGWVRQITVNTVRMELRRRRWRLFTSNDEAVLTHPDLNVPDEQERARLRHLYAALGRLNPDDRTLVVLRHLEGLELTELADTLDCSLSTLKRRLARAEHRLARTLGRGEHER